MWDDQTHPSDQTLLLALDRELSVRRQVALDRHLGACERCRARSSTIASMAAETSRWRRRGDAPPSTAVLRRRLQASMTEQGARWDRSLPFRMRRALAAVPVVIRVGAAAVLMAVVLPLVHATWFNSPVGVPIEPVALPISRLTPGVTSNLSVRDLCSGSVQMRRIVSMAVRQQVLQQYRMAHVAPSEYELDYLITPELGGVADARNLWPQRYDSGVWNARVKDDLERLLPRLVCDGAIDLGLAQREIADNWIDAYKKYFRTEHPIARQADLVEDDDDEIQFESTANALTGDSALVSSQHPPILLAAALGAFTKEASFIAPTRRVAW